MCHTDPSEFGKAKAKQRRLQIQKLLEEYPASEYLAAARKEIEILRSK